MSICLSFRTSQLRKEMLFLLFSVSLMFHDIDLKKKSGIPDTIELIVVLTTLVGRSTVTVVVLVLESRIGVAGAVAAEVLGHF